MFRGGIRQPYEGYAVLCPEAGVPAPLGSEMVGTLKTILDFAQKLAALLSWAWKQCSKLWRSVIHPEVPRRTLRLVPEDRANTWSMGSVNKRPAMQIDCHVFITNVCRADVLLCRVGLRKPSVAGEVLVRHPGKEVYGDYPILSGATTKVAAYFWIEPPVCQPDDPFVADVDFTDQFGNAHRLRKLTFRPIPKKVAEKPSVELEVVSQIHSRIEREVATVLQAEIDRYRACGRKVGGLGSLTTCYHGGQYRGMGTDWREADSPKLQSIVQDPENVRIESDNVGALMGFYRSLSAAEQEEAREALLARLSRDTPYAPVGYFIVYMLYCVGHLSDGLVTAKEELRGDSGYGFSECLRLVDGLLKWEYPAFTSKMLDDVEQFVSGLTEETFRIRERLAAVRTFLLSRKAAEDAQLPSPDGPKTLGLER